MNRRLIGVFVGVPLIALIAWIASNTYWADVTLPLPPRGEALTNPFYASQRFVEALGSTSAWDRVFATPPARAIVVLSSWHWSLSTGRREALKHWVESGGRLVVDSSLADGSEDFERWSGIATGFHDDEPEPEPKPGVPARDDNCAQFDEPRDPSSSSNQTIVARYWLCDFDTYAYLTPQTKALWVLRGKSGIQAARVQVGRGRVTVLNGSPFRYRALFEGDHGRLFVAATELQPHDEVHFLSEDDHPSLLALTWRYGAGAVILTLSLIGLAVWRGGVRFGPLAAALPFARRSLAEQIRGTGRFASQHGGDALHTASVRALDEAASKRVPGYSRLTATARGDALARLTGLDRHAILKAIHHEGARRPNQLRETIALLEAARRLTLVEHTR